jgi:peptide/nickel transport system substrate-binding protein
VRRNALALLVALQAGWGCARGVPATAPASFVIAAPYELTSLDPHAQDKLGTYAILSNVYEPLVSFDADMKIRPCLALSWESPDASTWVFHLRPSVAFHDGRPFGARDVVYSFRRLLGSADLEFRNYVLSVADVAALDDHTVRIRTSLPSRIFLNKIGNVLVVAEGARFQSVASANGTGPYRLTGWAKEQTVRLVRNATYWGDPPAIPQVHYALGRAPHEALRGLREGRFQLIQCDSKKAETELVGGGFRVVRRDNLFVKHLGFDLANDATPFSPARPNPFKDVRVRRAIHIGLDRQRLVRELWSDAVPATQPVPRFVFGFDPGIQEPLYDREAARALLRRARLGKGFDVVLHTRRIFADAAAVVKEELGALGIRVEPRLLPDVEFFDLVGRGGATFWLNRFSCTSGDASDFLDAVVHSRRTGRPFGKNNYGGYGRDDLDRAIEASAGIEKPHQRRDAIQGVLRRAMEDLVVIPLYNDQDIYAMAGNVSWQPRSDSYIRAAEIGVR